MKANLLILVVLSTALMVGAMNGQVMLQRAVVSNAGGTATNGTTRFDYTVGEPAVGTASNGSTMGYFGFYGANNNAVSGVRTVQAGTIQGVEISPNPVSTIVAINVSLSNSGPVDVQLYDVTGRQIATLFSGIKEAGTFSIGYNVGLLAKGKYLVAIRAQGALLQSQFTVVR